MDDLLEALVTGICEVGAHMGLTRWCVAAICALFAAIAWVCATRCDGGFAVACYAAAVVCCLLALITGCGWFGDD